jgi:large subunit ribosomal protein L32
MPVPKRKRSRARRDSRFADKGIDVKAFTLCPNCQTPLVTHAACTNCGHYKGVKVMVTKLDRAVKRSKVRETRAARQKATPESADASAEQ